MKRSVAFSSSASSERDWSRSAVARRDALQPVGPPSSASEVVSAHCASTRAAAPPSSLSSADPQPRNTDGRIEVAGMTPSAIAARQGPATMRYRSCMAAPTAEPSSSSSRGADGSGSSTPQTRGTSRVTASASGCRCARRTDWWAGIQHLSLRPKRVAHHRVHGRRTPTRRHAEGRPRLRPRAPRNASRPRRLRVHVAPPSLDAKAASARSRARRGSS